MVSYGIKLRKRSPKGDIFRNFVTELVFHFAAIVADCFLLDFIVKNDLQIVILMISVVFKVHSIIFLGNVQFPSVEGIQFLRNESEVVLNVFLVCIAHAVRSNGYGILSDYKELLES